MAKQRIAFHVVDGVVKETPTYVSWKMMKRRCFNRRNKMWPGYGGKGITVCERWMKFANFLADMGDRPSGKTLDRINSRGNYEPGNCRWATPLEQSNNSRTNKVIAFCGKFLTMSQWGRELGIPYTTIKGRIANGWPVEKALAGFNFHTKRRATPTFAPTER